MVYDHKWAGIRQADADRFLDPGLFIYAAMGDQAAIQAGDLDRITVRQVGSGRLLRGVPEAVPAVQVERPGARAVQGQVRKVGEQIFSICQLEREDTRADGLSYGKPDRTVRELDEVV
jgi:hypothetical protein